MPCRGKVGTRATRGFHNTPLSAQAGAPRLPPSPNTLPPPATVTALLQPLSLHPTHGGMTLQAPPASPELPAPSGSLAVRGCPAPPPPPPPAAQGRPAPPAHSEACRGPRMNPPIWDEPTQAKSRAMPQIPSSPWAPSPKHWGQKHFGADPGAQSAAGGRAGGQASSGPALPVGLCHPSTWPHRATGTEKGFGALLGPSFREEDVSLHWPWGGHPSTPVLSTLSFVLPPARPPCARRPRQFQLRGKHSSASILKSPCCILLAPH